MSESFTERFTRETANRLQQSLERLQQRLQEAEYQAPPPIYQKIEALRELLREDSEAAREKTMDLLKQIGTSESEFLDWLQQDVERLEQRLIQALGLAADPTQVDLARLRQTPETD